MTDQVTKNYLAQYLLLRQEAADIKADMDRVKEALQPYFASARLNAKGSKVLDFKDPLVVSGKTYPGVQETRKVQRTLNEERVIEFLKKRSEELDEHYLEPIVTVEHVDFDVLWDLHVRDLITEEELDRFFDETVTWAFTPIAE